jgi:hypothetical protein
MINPLLVVGVLVLIAILLLGVVGVLLRQGYKQKHPSIETRQKVLEEAVMMDKITANEYAVRKISLDREAETKRLRRRLHE